MRNLRAAAIGLILTLTGVAQASDVHDLKADSFKDFVGLNELSLIEFYAPWCGHCKALAPEYEEAASTLKEKNIPLAKVDCTEEGELCKEYGVEGYPTVKVFRGLDNVKPYAGARKAPAIISYMTKQSLPAVSVLTTDTLEEFKAADHVVLVAYLGADDKTSNATFAAVADSLRDDYLFGATNDATLAAAEGVAAPAVVLYKDFDEGKNTFSGPFDQEAITAFAKKASTPLVGEVGPETYAGYMAANIPLAYIFAETPEERATLAKSLKPVAEKYKGKVNFATIDAKAFGAHAGNLNLEVGKWPAFAIQETVKNQKFPFAGTKLTEKAIDQFVQDFVDGKTEPSIKSEPIPEKQEGPVTVIVAHTYKDIIINNDKDVLVMMHAPWCGHCKALAPKWEELAQMYTGNPDFADKVTVAKIDATQNDVPDDIAGFPTIKLFPAGAKDSPVEYQGGRTIEDLANFVRDNGKYHIDAWGAQNQSQTDDEDDSVVMSDAPETTTEMAHAAPAATISPESVSSAASAASEAASSASGGAQSVIGKVADAAKVVVDTLIDDEAGISEHDEL